MENRSRILYTILSRRNSSSISTFLAVASCSDSSMAVSWTRRLDHSLSSCEVCSSRVKARPVDGLPPRKYGGGIKRKV